MPSQQNVSIAAIGGPARRSIVAEAAVSSTYRVTGKGAVPRSQSCDVVSCC